MPRAVLGDVTHAHASPNTRRRESVVKMEAGIKSYMQQRFAHKKSAVASGFGGLPAPALPTANEKLKRGSKRACEENRSPPKRRRVTLAQTLSEARRKVLSRLEQAHTISSAGKERIEKSSTPVMAADCGTPKMAKSNLSATAPMAAPRWPLAAPPTPVSS